MHCPDCGNGIPPSEVRCPHCGRPGHFPNVRAASQPEELTALRSRHDEATTFALAAGLEAEIELLDEVALAADVVINRPLHEVLRLATSDRDIYATFYALVDAGLRLPASGKWSRIRQHADNALFPGYLRDIRFAVLSPDGRGIPYYGNWSLVLRTDMIAYRATVFQENSAIWLRRLNIESIDDLLELPRGYRAPWDQRDVLARVKLVPRLRAGLAKSDVEDLLISISSTPGHEDFLEVHIWGPLTIKTIARVVVQKAPVSRSDRVLVDAVREKLEEADVELVMQ